MPHLIKELWDPCKVGFGKYTHLQVIALATLLQVLHLGMESHVCALKIRGLFQYEKDLLQDLNRT